MRRRSPETLQTALMKVRIQRPHGNQNAKPILQQNNRQAGKFKASGDFGKVPKFPCLQRQGHAVSLIQSTFFVNIMSWSV